MVEVIDTNGNVLEVKTREEVTEKNLLHKGAFVIVRNDQGQVYAQKRSARKEVYPGLWCVSAGGGVVAGESFDSAAKRELEEELGIMTDVEFAFDFSFKSDVANYVSKIYVAAYNGELRPNPEEIETSRWVSQQEIEDMTARGELSPDTAQYMKIYFRMASSR